MRRCKVVAALALAVAVLTALPCPAPSCSLCNNLQAPTIREEAAHSGARLILAGTLENARLGVGGSGVTDLHITDILRKDDWLAGRKVVELPRYLAVSDAKNPPRFLVFCDIYKDRLDPYRGVPIKNEETVEYVKKAMALDAKDRSRNLDFFFNYLENSDPEVARDAYLEFAKATDAEIARAAPKLRPEKLREWLKNPQTQQDRLSLYALLLGACGGAGDADLFATMLNDGTTRSTNAFDGLLAGYIRLRPREGWQLAIDTLRGGKRRVEVRIAILRTLRYYHNSQPIESRANVLQAMTAILQQGELADVAVEDLRQWKMWDLTPPVLALYGKKGFDSPIAQRAIVRYALTCKDREDARRFVAERRKAEPDMVQEVEEWLKPAPSLSQ
jgi:hypothetical protein